MSSVPAARLVAMIRGAAADGLTEAAEHVRLAARRITPDDPMTVGDDLRASLTVEPATEGDLESQVYTDSEYAVYQHENLTIRHPTGQSKYLESATISSARDVEQIIAAAVRRRMS